ncbi:MAG: sensor histidine kinase [Halorientalis sp.]
MSLSPALPALVLSFVVVALPAWVPKLRDWPGGRWVALVLAGVAGWTARRALAFAPRLGLPVAPDPTALVLLAGATAGGLGLVRSRVRDEPSLDGRRALCALDDGVVVVDADGVVTRTNPAARDILDLEDEGVGSPLADILGQHPPLRAVAERDRVDGETVRLPGPDGDRHVLVSKTPVEEEGVHVGAVVTLADRTSLVHHEADLDLLRAILGRVLRHDVRNELTVIRMNAELLAHRTEGRRAERAEAVVEAADAILDTTEKARAFGSLVDADRERYEQDLCAVATDVADWAARTFPGVVLDVDCPATVRVRADEDLPLAVRSLVENAVVHNDAAAPAVWLRVVADEDTARLIVEDDGPGISLEECRAVRDRSVDPLEHGSGLGLWLVDWVVRNSGGDVDIAPTDSGTRVTVELPRSRDGAR